MSSPPLSRDLYRRFLAHDLPKVEWTHEAHLAVCWHALSELTVDEAILFLRSRISSYNESVGTANTPTDGYHETITEFFVRLVADVDAESPEVLFVSDRCTRGAPLDFWTRETLFSVEARAAWVEPDKVVPAFLSKAG